MGEPGVKLKHFKSSLTDTSGAYIITLVRGQVCINYEDQPTRQSILNSLDRVSAEALAKKVAAFLRDEA